MKKILIFLLLSIFGFSRDISGLYDMSFDGNDNYVEVFKKNNKYYALAFSNKKELESGENNKQKVQNNPQSVFVWNLSETKDEKFTNGKIRNLKNGRIYHISAKVDGQDLIVKVSEDNAGILGLSMKWRALNSDEIKLLQSRRVDISKLTLPE